MDLSVQKMQPPASLQAKSAAKRTNQGDSEDAVEDVARDQQARFTHGNTGYEALDPDEERRQDQQNFKRGQRRKQRQLLSKEDLSQLTTSVQTDLHDGKSADELMNLRAYQTQTPPDQEEDKPHFEVNI